MKSLSATRTGSASANAESQPKVHKPRGKKKFQLPLWVSAVSARFHGSLGWLTSAIVHMVVVIALALITDQVMQQEGPVGLTLVENPPPVKLDKPPEYAPVISPVIGDLNNPQFNSIETIIKSTLIPSETNSEDQSAGPAVAVALPQTNDAIWKQSVPSKSAGGVKGRGKDGQAQLLLQRGGSPATQDAAERALAWIAAQQAKDGSWNFDLSNSPQKDQNTHAGTVNFKIAATGMALLPFLGKGYTHKEESPYQQTVEQGLYYLTNHMLITKNGGDLTGSHAQGMYGHGLASIALCEAYAMTYDPNLKTSAQQAIRFIEYAQHKEGGWRYKPGMPGDTSVFGWQFMALKSGLLGDLRVSSQTVGLGENFLNKVQSRGGSHYGYERAGVQPTTTAIGLLCRMYMGWDQFDARLVKGADYISREGPSEFDMYYNYYATNVMIHYGEPHWKKWNRKLSNFLVKSQSTQGFESGSWYFQDPYAEEGGRLYITCLCAMILEVYYRHMPLYSEETLEFRF